MCTWIIMTILQVKKKKQYSKGLSDFAEVAGAEQELQVQQSDSSITCPTLRLKGAM